MRGKEKRNQYKQTKNSGKCKYIYIFLMQIFLYFVCSRIMMSMVAITALVKLKLEFAELGNRSRQPLRKCIDLRFDKNFLGT